MLFPKNKTFVIAEVGSNHLGDPALAKEGIYAAKKAGANAVKFQMYRAEELVDDKMPILNYIAKTHPTQRERFKSLQLPEQTFFDLAKEAEALDIMFMVTPFYPDAVKFLEPLVPAFKIASGDLTNLRLIEACVKTKKPIILSTGLSDIKEIEWAVSKIPRSQLNLLHCVGAYPTPDDQVNLNTIPFLSNKFNLPIGYSDHSIGITACVAAAAMGANIIEKHFLPNNQLHPADEALSVGPRDFSLMVDEIRRVEEMLGNIEKNIQADEIYFKTTLRRSIYLRKDILPNQKLDVDDFIPLRPWNKNGVSPQDTQDIIGKRVIQKVQAGTILLKSNIK